MVDLMPLEKGKVLREETVWIFSFLVKLFLCRIFINAFYRIFVPFYVLRNKNSFQVISLHLLWFPDNMMFSKSLDCQVGYFWFIIAWFWIWGLSKQNVFWNFEIKKSILDYLIFEVHIKWATFLQVLLILWSCFSLLFLWWRFFFTIWIHVIFVPVVSIWVINFFVLAIIELVWKFNLFLYCRQNKQPSINLARHSLPIFSLHFQYLLVYLPQHILSIPLLSLEPFQISFFPFFKTLELVFDWSLNWYAFEVFFFLLFDQF